jgi:hypothetical protein
MAKGKSNQIFSCCTQSFFVTESAYFSWGRICDIFFPCIVIFSLRGHALLSLAVYWGKIFFSCVSMFFPCVSVFPPGHAFTFLPRQLLVYELEENNIILPPWSSFIPTCDRKHVKNLIGERKWYIFPYFHNFPPWTMLYWVPRLRQLWY